VNLTPLFAIFAPPVEHYLWLLSGFRSVQLLHFPINFLEELLDALNVLLNSECSGAVPLF